MYKQIVFILFQCELFLIALVKAQRPMSPQKTRKIMQWTIELLFNIKTLYLTCKFDQNIVREELEVETLTETQEIVVRNGKSNSKTLKNSSYSIKIDKCILPTLRFSSKGLFLKKFEKLLFYYYFIFIFVYLEIQNVNNNSFQLRINLASIEDSPEMLSERIDASHFSHLQCS